MIDKEIKGKVDNIEEKIMNLSLEQKEKLYGAIKDIEEIIDILE